MKLSTQQRLLAMNNTVVVLRVLTQPEPQRICHSNWADGAG
jgi:hypothetical protein